MSKEGYVTSYICSRYEKDAEGKTIIYPGQFGGTYYEGLYYKKYLGYNSRGEWVYQVCPCDKEGEPVWNGHKYCVRMCELYHHLFKHK